MSTTYAASTRRGPSSCTARLGSSSSVGRRGGSTSERSYTSSVSRKSSSTLDPVTGSQRPASATTVAATCDLL